MEGDDLLRLGILHDGISIHTLRVEGDQCADSIGVVEVISIHTLRVEGDILSVYTFCFHDCISIHTLRVEGDPKH